MMRATLVLGMVQSEALVGQHLVTADQLVENAEVMNDNATHKAEHHTERALEVDSLK